MLSHKVLEPVATMRLNQGGVHHKMCGHSGERMVTGYSVDGFCLDTNMVFQFHGCHWYGCPECFPKGQKDHVDTRDAVCKNAGKSEGDPRHGVGADLMLPA